MEDDEEESEDDYDGDYWRETYYTKWNLNSN